MKSKTKYIVIIIVILFPIIIFSRYHNFEKDDFESFLFTQIVDKNGVISSINDSIEENSLYKPTKGFINDKEKAIGIAKIILPSIYGNRYLMREFSTYFYKNKIWIIRTNRPDIMGYIFGYGDIFVYINSQDGRIIGVCATKD